MVTTSQTSPISQHGNNQNFHYGSRAALSLEISSHQAVSDARSLLVMAEAKMVQWHNEAQQLVHEFRARQKDYRAAAKIYQQKRLHNPPDKAIDERRALRTTGIAVHKAKKALISLLEYLFKQEYQKLYIRMYEMLPAELCHQIYDWIIEHTNATVYRDKENEIKFCNGASATTHILDAAQRRSQGNHRLSLPWG
ncbi:hypothetical protein NX059_011258 [Plenodomus lindquistii]|nr:hypothetical protein NX059_011258 [Plenodomus lindquistii]